MERECNKCINHTSGMCSSWDCKMQTVEDVKREAREKAIEEFAEAYKKANITKKVYERLFHMIQFEDYDFHKDTEYIDSLYCDLADEIAEQLKGE